MLKKVGIYTALCYRELFVYHYNGEILTTNPLDDGVCRRLPTAKHLKERLAQRQGHPIPTKLSSDEEMINDLT